MGRPCCPRGLASCVSDSPLEICGTFRKFHALGREDEVPPKVRRRGIRKPQVFKFIERQLHFVVPHTLIKAADCCAVKTWSGYFWQLCSGRTQVLSRNRPYPL